MTAVRDPMELVGVPYKRGGTDPASGFDCFTLVRYVRQEYFGRETPAGTMPTEHLTSAQAAALAIFRALGGQERINTPWVECEPAEGCVAALGMWKVSRLHHCGVLVNAGILHALESPGVVWMPIERVWDVYARVEYFECRT